MKTVFAIIALFVITTVVHSQYSRSFYTTETAGSIRSTTMMDIGGETHFFAMKESKEDTMRIVAGHINAYGETSNYVQTEVLGTTFTNLAVSGSGSLQVDNALIAVLTNFSGIATLHYLRYDSNAGSVTNEYSLPIDFSGPFCRTRQNGDSLITYSTYENGGIVRIAASIDDPSFYTETLIQPGTTSVGSLSNNSRFAALKIDWMGSEIACVGNLLIKRLNNGSFSTTTMPNFAQQELYGYAIGANSSGNILIMSGQKYALYTNSLALITNGNVNHPFQNNSRFIEINSDGTEWIVYVQNNNGQFEQLSLSTNGIVLLSQTIGEQTCTPIDFNSVNNKHHLISNWFQFISMTK